MLWPGFLTLALALSGCVTKGQHELVEVQLDATRTALSTRTAQCAEEVREQREALANASVALHEAEQTMMRVAEMEGETRVRVDALLRQIASLSTVDPSDEKQQALDASVDRLAKGLAVLALEEDLSASRDRQHQQLVDLMQPFVESGVAVVVADDEGSRVRIASKQFFQEGSFFLSPRGLALAEKLGNVFEQLKGRQIRIEGHTDALPVHTSEYASNWELGFRRAAAVGHGLEDLIGDRMHLSSRAGLDPVEGELHRVEFVLLFRTEPVLEMPKTDGADGGEKLLEEEGLSPVREEKDASPDNP